MYKQNIRNLLTNSDTSPKNPTSFLVHRLVLGALSCCSSSIFWLTELLILFWKTVAFPRNIQNYAFLLLNRPVFFGCIASKTQFPLLFLVTVLKSSLKQIVFLWPANSQYPLGWLNDLSILMEAHLFPWILNERRRMQMALGRHTNQKQKNILTLRKECS